jgi:hypothetical protein
VTGRVESGLPGVALEPGDHICGFFFGVEERDSVLLPYLRAGLQTGDKCICVVDASEPATVLESMGADNDLDVHRFVQSEQLDIRKATEAYLSSGAFSTDDMISFLDDFVRDATVGGDYARVRIAGEATWVLDEPPGFDKLIEYESELNRFVIRYPQIILCLYDLQRFGGGMLVDLMKTHPKILLGGMVLDNPHYLSPDEFRATTL